MPGVAYPGVRDNRSTLNTKTGYDDDDDGYIKDGQLGVVHCYGTHKLQTTHSAYSAPEDYSICHVATIIIRQRVEPNCTFLNDQRQNIGSYIIHWRLLAS